MELHQDQEWVLESVNLDFAICSWFGEAKISSKEKPGCLLKAGGTFPSCKQHQPSFCLPAAGVLRLKVRLWSPPWGGGNLGLFSQPTFFNINSNAENQQE